MYVKYSKIIVALVLLLVVIFTAAVLYVYLQTGSEPSTLVAAFFAFVSVELLSLAGIKIKKGE